MPNIKTYENNVNAPKADEAGSGAFEQLGRHAEASYSLAGQAISRGLHEVGQQITEHEDLAETTKVMKQMSDLDIQTDKDFEAAKTSMDPNDPDAMQKFLDAHQQSVDAIGEGLDSNAGKKMYDEMSNRYRANTATKFVGYQSQAAANQIVDNVNNTVIQKANQVAIHPEEAAQQISDIDVLAAHLPAEHRDAIVTEAKAKIADSGVESVIGKLEGLDAPTDAQFTAARNFLNDPKNGFTDHASPGKMVEAENRISSMHKNMGANQRAQIDFNERQAQLQTRSVQAQLASSFINADGSSAVNSQTFAKIAATGRMLMADTGEVTALYGFAKNVQAGKYIADDPATTQSLRSRMFVPEGQPGALSNADIYQANYSGLISNQTAGQLISQKGKVAQDPALKGAMAEFNRWAAAQKPAFTHADPLSLTGADPAGAAQYNQFYQEAQQRFMDTYSKGGDWRGAISANNKEYLGSLAQHYTLYQKGAPVGAVANSSFKTGAVVSGYQFLGQSGNAKDWADKTKWKKVGQ